MSNKTQFLEDLFKYPIKYGRSKK